MFQLGVRFLQSVGKGRFFGLRIIVVLFGARSAASEPFAGGSDWLMLLLGIKLEAARAENELDEALGQVAGE